jgi:hypothetical protein
LSLTPALVVFFPSSPPLSQKAIMAT